MYRVEATAADGVTVDFNRDAFLTLRAALDVARDLILAPRCRVQLFCRATTGQEECVLRFDVDGIDL